jgi:hypothetical protein
MIFFFFSSRHFESDFRKPLIKALIAKGHVVWHVRIGRSNVLTRPDRERTEFSSISGLVRLISLLRAYSKTCKSPVICVETTGCCVPVRSMLLIASLRGLWCFDVFDNLLYDLRGLHRLKRWLDINLLTWLCPIKIVLSRELLRITPNAYHLDNAVDIRREDRVERNFSDLMTLFSIDVRFDFELVKEVAASAPQRKIYLYGRVANGNQKIKFRLEELCAYSNVIYRGEYVPDDVDAILAPFGIGFAPYVTNSFMTEFINPDKYYLYLQSGMEVISTDIPQARRMDDRIHIARSAGEIVEMVTRIESDPTYRKNKDVTQNPSWDQRAEELIEIVQSHIISHRIGSKRSTQL